MPRRRSVGAGQNVTLNATITSAAGTVNEGTETFTILNGTTVVGTPVTVNVAAGAASASYVLPAGTRRHLHHPGRVQRDDQLPRDTDTSQTWWSCRRDGDGRRQCLGDLQLVPTRM